MIFVTVGGQLPFDRLVHAVDRWAVNHPEEAVFAQIGASRNPPSQIEWKRFLTHTDFQTKARRADVIVAHAGMGSILTALELAKPIVVMPRRAHLGEHRNDHQSATVSHLVDYGISVAADEEALADLLDRLPQLQQPAQRHGKQYERLLDFLRGAIATSR
jgi:UDP-N-acetylglucosamine transferase subunit ALG13